MATIGSIGEELNLLIKQGSTFKSNNIQLFDSAGNAVDLTSCILRGHIRKEPSDVDPIAILDFVFIDQGEGEFFITMAKEVTEVIPAGQTIKSKESQYVWDCEIEDSLGQVVPLYYGSVKIFREVTHG